jgi:hypothetical protein
MHLASNRCLNDNAAKMTGFMRYAELKAGVDNYLAATGAIISEQEKDRRGVAGHKRVLRERMMDLTMRVSTCLVSYATIEAEDELLAEARITESSLRKAADTKVKEKAELILRLGNSNQPKLVDYGLVTDDLTNLPIAIADYFAAIPEPKLTKAERVRLTAQLKLNQKATDDLFKSIDTFVATKEKQEPELYAEYFNARKIERTGYRMRACEVFVKNGVTGEPVAKAKVEVRRKSGTELSKSVKRTGATGQNFYQTLPPAEYECIVELGGFEKATVSFVQNEGITTKLVIELQPVGVLNPV